MKLCEAYQLYRNEDKEDRLAFVREDIKIYRLMIIVQDSIIRLLHNSVKDFLVGDEDRFWINDLEAHTALAN